MKLLKRTLHVLIEHILERANSIVKGCLRIERESYGETVNAFSLAQLSHQRIVWVRQQLTPFLLSFSIEVTVFLGLQANFKFMLLAHISRNLYLKRLSYQYIDERNLPGLKFISYSLNFESTWLLLVIFNTQIN